MMKRLIFIVMTAWVIGVAQAQDNSALPPEGYQDSCEAEPILYDYFGPNCLNPVTWDLAGFKPIGTWVFFVRGDGSQDGGVIRGYLWDQFRGVYDYWVMTEMPHDHYEHPVHGQMQFGGKFEHVPLGQLLEEVL